MSLIFCIYHSVDPDGFASAALVKKKYDAVIFFPYNYEENINFLNRIPKESTIFIVDTSFPNHILKKLNEYNDVHWIDHHDTAIEESKLDEVVFNMKGKRENGKSATLLTYEYLFPNEIIPKAIELINAYDIYDTNYFPEALIFNYFLQTKNIKINNITYPFWLELFEYDNYEIDQLISKYSILYDYVKMQNEITAKSICYEGYVFHYRCIVANRSRIGSDFFESVVTDDHDMMVAWHITKKGDVKYTFYSNKPDVHVGNIAKEIVKKIGGSGGGHLGAAGGRFNRILFPNKNLLPDKGKNDESTRIS